MLSRITEQMPAAPAPLLWPAIAFAAGIASAAQMEIFAAANIAAALSQFSTFTPIAAALLLGMLVWTHRRRDARNHMQDDALTAGRFAAIWALVAVVSFSVGYSRYEQAVRLGPRHITNFVAGEPFLTRLSGRIVTTPLSAPAEKRNPFLPFDPPPRTQFMLDVQELRTVDPPENVNGYVRITVEADAIDAHLGDDVVLTGTIYRPAGPRNPGDIDWARILRLQGVHAAMKVPGSEYIAFAGGAGNGRNWRAAVARLRAFSQSLLFEPYAAADDDESRSVLDAMVLGQRSNVTDEINDAFMRTGTIHILSVSGAHVGMLAIFVWFIMRWVLRRSSTATACATLVVLLLYLVVVEWNAPILRATLIGVLACVAILRNRPLCIMNWLALSAILILAYNPLELFRAGFQLSFAQVAALVLLVPGKLQVLAHFSSWSDLADAPRAEPTQIPAIARHILWGWLRAGFVVGVVAWAASLPLVVFHFGQFALLGAFQSMVVMPAATITIVLGFLTVLLSWLPIINGLLAYALLAVSALMLWLVKLLASLPGTLIEASPPPWPLVLATYCVFLPAGSHVLTVIEGRRRARQSGETRTASTIAGTRLHGPVLLAASVIVALAWVAFALIPAWRWTSRPFELHVLSVGDGLASILTLPDRSAACFDLGTSSNFDVGITARRALRDLQVSRLSAISISHTDLDHYSGVPSLVADFAPDRTLVSRYFHDRSDAPGVKQLLSLLPPNLFSSATVRQGDNVALGAAFARAGGSFTVLWPPDDLDKKIADNDTSLVLRLTIHGQTVLIPGDIERAAIRGLLSLAGDGQLDLKSDVLIAPHHGSIVQPETRAFYTAVAPRFVIVPSGRDRPALAELVRNAVGPSCRVLNTHDAHAVRVRFNPGSRVTVDTPFARE